MNKIDLLRAREQTAARIVGMLESSEFVPEKNRDQRRLFRALCDAHKAIFLELTAIDDLDVGENSVTHLTTVLRLLEEGLAWDAHASGHFRKAKDTLENFLNTFPTH